jgi:hypothetical protein
MNAEGPGAGEPIGAFYASDLLSMVPSAMAAANWA